MGLPFSALVFAWWCLFLLWAGWPTRADLKVLSVNCSCDYDTLISCEWKMNRPTNCSSEIWLYYERKNDNSIFPRCTPKSKKESKATLSLECVCQSKVDSFVNADEYLLQIQSDTQVLWEEQNFLPSQNVKPRAPRNLIYSQGTSKDVFFLTWDNNYPPDHFLIEELRYMVEIQKKKDTIAPSKTLDNLTELNLTFLAYHLENKSTYTARVRSKVSDQQTYAGQWSDWSPSVEWFNEYEQSFLHRLELGVPVFCILILLVNLLCYFGVIKIKKVWWDQIPNPAHSHLTAIIIQNQQLSTWRKLPKTKEKKNFLHWKTCLSKLFPCLFSHNSAGKEEDPHPPLPSKREGWPMEACRAVLLPEQISVVQSLELFEAEVESEKADADDGSFCPSAENSASSFIQNREALAARFVHTLFLDLLGEETFMPSFDEPSRKYKDLADATESPPKESKDPGHCWDSPTRLGSPLFQNGSLSGPHTSERSGTACQNPRMETASPEAGQAPEPRQEQWQFPSASQTQGPGSASDLANTSISEALQVVDDNPAYRSFSSLLAQSLPRTEEEPSLPLVSSDRSQEQTTSGDPEQQREGSCSEGPKIPSSCDNEPSSLLQSDGESWEEILRQRVLRQEGAVPCPAVLVTSGYRCFDNAVKQGSDQNYKAASFNLPKESGYRSFVSLLNDSRKEASAETFSVESESGKEKEGSRPSENTCCQEAEKVPPLPLFTFGLDLGEAPSQKSQRCPVPSSLRKTDRPQETIEKETLGAKKHGDPPTESSLCSKLDFSSGIVYSTLTCHLCGHLKRCSSIDGSYTPLGNSQHTECNCVVEVLETLPHPLTKATSFCPSKMMESPESGVPRTPCVEFLGESHLEEESSPEICMPRCPQDCKDPSGFTAEKQKGSLHLKPSPGGDLKPNQPFIPNMADCQREGNTYIKVS
ncbi:interleukin-4 receptor subunit alpha [Antechinus flavipes]|uniref:interleukin-4 receptor subunit alpha n=1 Tax=Antechinus flavipes TaxID=38775 RepID=UPI002235FADB|nr:interleukin-4 receptor subunit alpha [Antechinus flavipes]